MFDVVTDVVVEEAVLLGNASSLHCHRDGNRMSELSLISGSFCHCQKLDEVISIDSEVGILDVVVVVLVDVVEDFLIIVVVNFGVTIADVVVNIIVVEEEVEVVLVIVLVVVFVETFAVEVIVVDVEVVVLAAVDKVVRIADDVETFWLLSLGVGELFGMLITLVMLGDSDQELETLLLACHIPCYVYLFFKTLNLSNKENNPCRDNKLIHS